MSGPFATPLGEPAGYQPDTDAFIDSIGGIDFGIERAVRVLHENHVETFESCQGGAEHPFPEPTVRFHGADAEGFRALAVALTFGLPVTALRRFWSIEGGLPHGPHWEMTFTPASPEGGPTGVWTNPRQQKTPPIPKD